MRQQLLAALSGHDDGESSADLSFARQLARRRFLGILAITAFVLLAVVGSAATAFILATGGSVGRLGVLGSPRALLVVTVMVIAGGGFVILRAALSHDQFSRRLDSLCRELESSSA